MKKKYRNEGQYLDHQNSKNVEKFRTKIGLNPNIHKVRKCLRCDVSFTSKGFENRMCNNCKLYTVSPTFDEHKVNY